MKPPYVKRKYMSTEVRSEIFEHVVFLQYWIFFIAAVLAFLNPLFMDSH